MGYYGGSSGAGSGGALAFTGLTDTPASIVAARALRGNGAGDALEFFAHAGERLHSGSGTFDIDQNFDWTILDSVAFTAGQLSVNDALLVLVSVDRTGTDDLPDIELHDGDGNRLGGTVLSHPFEDELFVLKPQLADPTRSKSMAIAATPTGNYAYLEHQNTVETGFWTGAWTLQLAEMVTRSSGTLTGYYRWLVHHLKG